MTADDMDPALRGRAVQVRLDGDALVISPLAVRSKGEDMAKVVVVTSGKGGSARPRRPPPSGLPWRRTAKRSSSSISMSGCAISTW